MTRRGWRRAEAAPPPPAPSWFRRYRRSPKELQGGRERDGAPALGSPQLLARSSSREREEEEEEMRAECGRGVCVCAVAAAGGVTPCQDKSGGRRSTRASAWVHLIWHGRLPIPILFPRRRRPRLATRIGDGYDLSRRLPSRPRTHHHRRCCFAGFCRLPFPPAHRSKNAAASVFRVEFPLLAPPRFWCVQKRFDSRRRILLICFSPGNLNFRNGW